MAFLPVTHVLFDMDGLILNTEDLYTVGFQKVTSRFGKEFTFELKSKIMGQQSKEFAGTIIDDLGLPLTVDEFLSETRAIFDELFPQCQIMPGVEKLIRHLHDHNVGIGLATSSSKESYDLKTVNHQKLFDLFPCKTWGTSDPDVKKGKPYPDIFFVAANKFPDKPAPEKSTPPPLVDWSYVPTLVLAVILVVVAATALAARAADGKQATRLPGPQALPFLGTRWLFWGRYKMNKLHEAYEDMFRRYGPVFVETTPGGASVVSIAERAALEAVLRAPAKRPYRPPTEIVQVYRRSRPDRYASTGLVNEQGEKWHHLRRHLTAELTSPNTMQGFLPELNNICDDFLELLESCRRSDGTVAGFDQLTNRMGLESVCGLMLGSRLGFLERWMSGRAATLAAAVKAHFRAQRDSYYGAPLWKFAPTTLYRTFVKSEETIHTIVSDLMEEAKTKKQGTANDDAMREIFLRILENPAVDMRDKKAAVIDFITAGIETLANSLVFLLYLLSGRPDWQRVIRSELPSCSTLTAEDLAAAPSVRAAIYEAFRLLPTAPFLARVLDTPMTVGGHKLSAGTFVLAHTGAACRREENFYRAREFVPERWLSHAAPHAPALVAPFGRGRRMCPGKRFVDLELHLLLAKIMQKWRVEFDGELDIQFDFLLAPKSPVSLRLVEW